MEIFRTKALKLEKETEQRERLALTRLTMSCLKGNNKNKGEERLNRPHSS